MAVDLASWVGQQVSEGRYRVVGKLGEGGMGLVFRAFDQRLQSDVVIKCPHPALLRDAEFVTRFRRETRSLVKLVHPHIVRILDAGEHDGVPFSVLQYLAGGSLEDRMLVQDDQFRRPNPLSLLAEWLPNVSEALDFVHREGHVHRDVKPANILFDADNHAFLGDFGIIKSQGNSKLTNTGLVLGTPEYMAPEVIMGKSYDGRSDQYALAVTVYQCLCGEVPFSGPTPAAILVNQSTQTALPLSQRDATIPNELSQAVSKALAKDPERRFATCREFANAVLAILRTLPGLRSPANQAATPTATDKASPTPSAGTSAKVACPSCDRQLRLTSNLSNMLIKCPNCGMKLRVSSDWQSLAPGASTMLGREPAAQGSSTSLPILIQDESARSSGTPRSNATAPAEPSFLQKLAALFKRQTLDRNVPRLTSVDANGHSETRRACVLRIGLFSAGKMVGILGAGLMFVGQIVLHGYNFFQLRATELGFFAYAIGETFLGTAISAVGGFLLGIIVATLYNLVAEFFGGVEIDIN